MRKTTFVAFAASALILAAIAGWTIGSNRSLQAEAATAIEPPIDTFSMMASEKALRVEEFQDFSLVFSGRGAEGRSAPTP